MAKFRVKVNVIAEWSYEVEVDEPTEARAEDAASREWQSHMPSDFQVNEGYVSEWEMESEQLTADCPGCGVEHTIPTAARSQAEAESWPEDYEYCKPCGAKIELEDKANGR